ncbi:MAG: hypothetical protein ACK4SF_04705 [Algoriphagus aquaeductus]|uniref:hypothetical protein n=1 Tax=Algoriphagus aquaeductus TaxID=475299 RepID=UPI00391D1A0D
MFTDLITGIIVGGGIAIFFVLRDNYKHSYFSKNLENEGKQKIVIRLSEEVSFLNKADIMLTLDHIPENQQVLIDGTNSVFIHPDILEIIEDFKATAKHKNIELELIGLENFNNSDKFWVG